MTRIPVIVLALYLSVCPASTSLAQQEIPATKLSSEHLDNLFRFDEVLFSGGLPAGEAAFSELRERGVGTVISVDGAHPDLVHSASQGLNYIHYPVSYNTIPEETALMIANAIRTATQPVYIHCHHGKHRGPSAGAMAMVLLGKWSPDTAVEVMKAAKTGANYTGLYACVQQAEAVSPDVLDALPTDFPSVAPVKPMVEMMVRIQHIYDHLKDSREAGWKTPDDHPDIVPAHEALQMREALHELGRSLDSQYNDVFRAMLKANEDAAGRLEDALRALEEAPGDETLIQNVDAQWDAVDRTCVACHAVFRNQPVND